MCLKDSVFFTHLLKAEKNFGSVGSWKELPFRKFPAVSFSGAIRVSACLLSDAAPTAVGSP
jgi:hypothetical protein